MGIESAKRAAGFYAVSLLREGMVVGVGSGSTVEFFIDNLIERCRDGFEIQAIVSSSQSEKLMRKGGIRLLDPHQIVSIDIAVDGADELDSKKRMIKGGGGALFREKIIASMSKETVIIVDETKVVPLLGRVPLPVEISPFGCEATRRHLERLGYHGEWRREKNNAFSVTDNHNYILDIRFRELREHPEQDHMNILQVPGVIETGFFFDLAHRVIIGYSDGRVMMQT